MSVNCFKLPIYAVVCVTKDVIAEDEKGLCCDTSWDSPMLTLDEEQAKEWKEWLKSVRPDDTYEIVVRNTIVEPTL